jgi:hypothetical protein
MAAKKRIEEQGSGIAAVLTMFGGNVTDEYTEQDVRQFEALVKPFMKEAAERRRQRGLASVPTEGAPKRRRFASMDYRG